MTNTNTSAVDLEAIGWAYQKLCAFGVQNTSMDNAMMMDRLNLMLLNPPDERPQWRDIADAPKEGTGILAFWNLGIGEITGLNYHAAIAAALDAKEQEYAATAAAHDAAQPGGEVGECWNCSGKGEVGGTLISVCVYCDGTGRVKLTPPPASQPAKQGEGDWTEDFAHENGNYTCQCCYCGRQFIGHKRRVTCKVCATHPAQATIKDGAAQAVEGECTCPQHGEWIAAADVNRMAREIDVAMNGEGAAKAPELCDVTASVIGEIARLREDAERINWLETIVDGFANIDRITSVNGKFNRLPSLREAIDTAIRASRGEGL